MNDYLNILIQQTYHNDYLIRIIIGIMLTILAVYFDIRSYKIPNKLIIVSIFMGIGLLIYDSLQGRFVVTYIYAMVMAFILLFIVYMFGGIGAGDVKLSAAMGFIFGFLVMIEVLVWTFLAAAFIGITSFIVGGTTTTVVRLNKKVSLKGHQFHFSIAILTGEIITIGRMFV
jgi:prepilin peptidase CpaA